MNEKTLESCSSQLENIVWLAGPSLAHLAKGPLALGCFDKPVVLFDTMNGPACLDDTCPHRQASLALGKVNNGCITCPFHGWRFDSCGDVAHIPAHPDHKLGARFKTNTVPTMELAGWVFLKCKVSEADGYLKFQQLTELEKQQSALLTPEVEPFFSLPESASKWHSISGIYDWQADFTRVVANAIDFAHLPFVHPSQFGNAENPSVESFRCVDFAGGAVAEQFLMPPDNWQQYLLRTFVQKGRKQPILGRLSFLAPNLTKLEIDLGFNAKMVIFDANVPVSKNVTRTYWTMHRNFVTNPLFDASFHHETKAVFDCDRRIVESQTGPLPLCASGGLHVASDALELKYRQILRSLLG